MTPARPLARGDVVLVPFPFTDLTTTKLRPAVVLRANAGENDVLLAFVGSRRIGYGGVGEVGVLPTHPEFVLTGLRAPSTVRASKIVTVARPLVRRWLGRLGPLLLADLDRALLVALGIDTTPIRENGRRDERARLLALHTTGGARAVLDDLGVVSNAG